MARFLMVVCGVCLLLGCSKQEPPRHSSAATPTVGKAASAPATVVATPNWFDRIKKQEAGELLKSQGAATREGLVLKLQLASGKPLQLTDKPNCESDADCLHHVYRGTVADGQFYWVEVAYYEGSTVLLIAKKTGEQVDVSAEPHLSPDGKYLVTISGEGDMAYGGDPSILLWEITDGEMKSSFKLSPEGVYYFQFENWDGSEKINLKAIKDPPEGLCKKYELAEYPMTLLRQHDRWAFQPGSEPPKCQ
jgi:hypothetical protein